MKLQQVPLRNDDFKLETLDEERILYHPAEPRAIYLNETASLVLELCDNERSVGDIVGVLSSAFPESKNIEQDVETTLVELVDYGALTIKAA